MNGTNHKIRYALIIISLIFITLLSTNIFLNDQLIESNICVPNYDSNTVTSIILLNAYLSIIGIGCVTVCIKKLSYFLVSIMQFEAESVYKLKKLTRKFMVFLAMLIISSLTILFSSVFAGYLYGLLLSIDTVLIISMDILIYQKYDHIFSRIFKCILPPPPPDKVKNLQQIADLFENEYNQNYQLIINDALKNMRNGTYYIPEDIVTIIIDFIEPITDLEDCMIYKPYWTPVTSTHNVRSDSMENMKYWKSSKYGGIPYLRSNDEWPVCTQCGHKLYLFLQLNMSQLPEEYSNLWLSQTAIYKPFLMQYFHCISPRCFNGNPGLESVYHTRFVLMDKEEIKEDNEYRECLRGYTDIEMQYNINTRQQRAIGDIIANLPLSEHVITRWVKEPAPQNNNNNVNNDEDDEKKNDVYDWNKYQYESPSIEEYKTFCLGLFDGLDVISHELEKRSWDENALYDLLKKPNKMDKLGGYFCGLAEKNTTMLVNSIPCCQLCDNPMNNMLYQLNGEEIGFKYKNEIIGGIYVCDNHPFVPQLVLLSTTTQVLPF